VSARATGKAQLRPKAADIPSGMAGIPRMTPVAGSGIFLPLN
jgi:hypothetical protein